MPHQRYLGVCYYPEHWPQHQWAEDAKRMADLGITYVRIGEFAWSRLEPAPNQLCFDWLEQAIDVLHQAGLKIILGTPTATPPKWLVDQIPDMLAVTQQGQTLTFGSRRHYCFSHQGYRAESARITTLLAKHFGQHPGLVGWQTDNEYGCHDTIRSWSPAACQAFQNWLTQKYQTIDALNHAWGNIFWSMEYPDFAAIDVPGTATTELNPSHLMDFYRFSSDQVVSFNKDQCDIIRQYSPGRDIIHNFMGRIVEFDHFDVGADLDISSWDSYPLGFLEDRVGASADHQRQYAFAGDPDFQAFHHDIYRATSKGRWWVMEQQPGPVNWAPYNPAPRAGMVRLWSWEAFAHGAETVSYFRWRQAPFAQEQMHAGLLRPDSKPATGFAEAAQMARDLGKLPIDQTTPADIAIIFDYPSCWAWDIQPQGQGFDHFQVTFDCYRALRRQGQSVDILPASTIDFSAYKAVFIPALFSWPNSLRQAITATSAKIIIGPRTGSKTEDFQIPSDLPPNLSKSLLDITVTHVETLRPDLPLPIANHADAHLTLWRDHLEVGSASQICFETSDDTPALIQQGHLYYLAGIPDDGFYDLLMAKILKDADLSCLSLPDGLRIRDNGNHKFILNYSDQTYDLSQLGITGAYLLGQSLLPPADVAVIDTEA